MNPAPTHGADTDFDLRVDLDELSREIELANARSGSVRAGESTHLEI